jgi:hypothetical protein
VNPLVRLRVLKSLLPEHSSAPLSFTFIPASKSCLPASLLPPATIATSTPTSAHSSPIRHPGPLSPHRTRRPPSYQDVLVFDPADGSLSLRRFTLEMRPRDQALPFPTSVPNLGSTSISLPGVSPPSRLGVSPPNPSGRLAGPLQTMDIPLELVGKDSIVASWSLKRCRDWREIRGILGPTLHEHTGLGTPKSRYCGSSYLHARFRLTHFPSAH